MRWIALALAFSVAGSALGAERFIVCNRMPPVFVVVNRVPPPRVPDPPPIVRPVVRPAIVTTYRQVSGHTHTCPRCGTTWGGPGHGHNCPNCGTEQRIQDRVPRMVMVRTTTTAPASAVQRQLAPVSAPARPPVQDVFQMFRSGGGCPNGNCATYRR